MRKIKFRGFDTELKKWHYGNYYFYTDSILCMATPEQNKENEHYCILFDGFCDWNMPRPHYKAFVDKVSIGQYTGLKDKNGKEIYEGDIIQIANVKAVVKWNDRTASFFGYDETNDIETTHLGSADLTEVIGNIYENSELLER